jgi:threonine/homoserine/homoserine lactone efflux protein
MALFFASLLPQFAPGGQASFAGFLALGLLFGAMTLVWLTCYAIAVHRLREVLEGSIRRALDAATGIVLVAFGLRLAASEQ